jgi:hypothetical protein
MHDVLILFGVMILAGLLYRYRDPIKDGYRKFMRRFDD